VEEEVFTVGVGPYNVKAGCLYRVRPRESRGQNPMRRAGGQNLGTPAIKFIGARVIFDGSEKGVAPKQQRQGAGRSRSFKMAAV